MPVRVCLHLTDFGRNLTSRVFCQGTELVGIYAVTTRLEDNSLGDEGSTVRVRACVRACERWLLSKIIINSTASQPNQKPITSDLRMCQRSRRSAIPTEVFISVDSIVPSTQSIGTRIRVRSWARTFPPAHLRPIQHGHGHKEEQEQSTRSLP